MTALTDINLRAHTNIKHKMNFELLCAKCVYV